MFSGLAEGFIAKFLSGIGNYLTGLLRRRITVRIVSTSTDRDVEQFLNLYEQMFRDNILTPPIEQLRGLDAAQKNKTRFSERILVAKIDRQVVGFLKYVFYYDSCYLFVSYLGIDKNLPLARRTASRIILRQLFKTINTDLKNCKGIVFELEKISRSLPKEENALRKARTRHFHEIASFGMIPHKFALVTVPRIKYVQPKIDLTDIQHSEEEMDLMFISAQSNIGDKISNEDIISILKFVYLQVYGESYIGVPDKDENYRQYCNLLLDNCVKKLEKTNTGKRS